MNLDGAAMEEGIVPFAPNYLAILDNTTEEEKESKDQQPTIEILSPDTQIDEIDKI